MKEDVLLVHHGDTNRDDILRYPDKTDDDDDDIWRKSSSDEEEEEDGHNTIDMIVEGGFLKIDEEEVNTSKTSSGEKASISREEVGDNVMVERNVYDGEREDGQYESSKVNAMEDEHESLKASIEKEDGQYVSLERGDKDDQQPVFERDEKVSRDNEESGSGSPGRDDLINTLTKVVGSEEHAGTRNGCEDRDESVDTTIRKMKMREVIGEQDSPSCTPDAVKVDGETIQNVYFSGPVLPQSPSIEHRRTQSEMGAPGHRRTNSFQRLKTQMQKAWRGVSNLRDDNRPTFNPEVLANQKRQWYQLHSSKVLDQTKLKEPNALFEHFIIVGLHPEKDLKPVEEAFRRRKKWEMEMSRYEVSDFRILRHRGPQFPILEPQILFKYPPGKKVAMRPKDLANFCFPGGVKARLLERIPSLSDLNELVYGQEHLGTDDSSFIFSFKVADDATLYGVCLHVSEIVQRPPGVLSTASPLHSSGGGSRYLVSAPRCYCLLTRVPFFELHFEMLNSMIAQERLKRITDFVSEMS